MSITNYDGTLSTHSFYILLAIADRPLHGYGIRDQIAIDSNSTVIIATGTLYPALQRLTKSGLLERIEAQDTPITHRYRLTPYGRRTLEHEAKRLGALYTHARYKLGHRLFGN
jgi:DNA-binding PadR family transcriptional regulator